ncbi:MAG: DUF3037 domain-containing protein [Flavobacteriaceae bacterium]|jgi:hypothetical protein|nr:DUF3037 domain-containing protein [Flavobacteriaceae bacterium]
MQDKILYEYAVIRVFPKVEREEFINAGILIYSKQAKKLLVKTYFNEKKFHAFETELDEEQVRLNLKSFELIAMADPNGGPIAKMDMPSRFRWMTAVRSSCIQTSRPHPGFADDLEKTLDRLFEELVL